MPAPGSRAPRLLRPAAQATYETVFHTVYLGLATNVLLALAVAPLLLALAVVADPPASWPFFAALSVVCAPALAGAFACFAGADGGTPVVLRTFWAAYRRTARRAMTCWVVAAAVVGILVVDTAAVLRTSWGPALAPFFLSAAVLVVAAAVAVIAVLAAPPPGTAVRLRDIAWPCLYVAARRWYLAIANIAVLGLAGTLVLVQPVPGMLIACAPLLYVVWANTRFMVAPILKS